MSGTSPTKLQVLASRSLSSAILLAILVGMVVWGNAYVVAAVCWAMCAISGWEVGQMLKRVEKGVAWWLPIWFGIIYPPVLSATLLFDILPNWQAVSLAIVAIIAFIWEMRRVPDGEMTAAGVGLSVLSCAYPVWMFSFIQEVLFRAPVAESVLGEVGSLPGLWLAVWLIGVTKITDIGAYISGSLFGKNKMIPHISPKKTWEGFYGALFFAVGLGIGVFLWKPDHLILLNNWWQAGLLALVLAVVSVFGDLAGSLIKRSLSVKDSGNLLPGIGGIFDLIDSPAFTVPLFVLICM